MSHIGGKNTKKTSSDSKRHFTVVIGNKEHGLYVSSSPSSAAKKAVTKLCAANKGKKVDFYIREITQGSKKKTYGPYVGQIEKLKEPIELKGRVIKYKPVAKLSDKNSKKMKGGEDERVYTFNDLGNTAGSTPLSLNELQNNAKKKAEEAKKLKNIAKQKKQNAIAADERATAAKIKANQSKKVYEELLANPAANERTKVRTNTIANASVNASANTQANVLANAAENPRTSSHNKISKPNNSSQ
jgi:hypothetical protein